MRNRLELSAYAMEELYPLSKEMDSLRNVIFKVEMELQEAKKTGSWYLDEFNLVAGSLNKLSDKIRWKWKVGRLFEVQSLWLSPWVIFAYCYVSTVFVDRKEEYAGLMQDWLILNTHRAELTARKQNLQTLWVGKLRNEHAQVILWK